jgi:hypothetical protein
VAPGARGTGSLQQAAALAHARDPHKRGPEVPAALVLLALALLVDDAHLPAEAEEVDGGLVGNRKCPGGPRHAGHAPPAVDAEDGVVQTVHGIDLRGRPRAVGVVGVEAAVLEDIRALEPAVRHEASSVLRSRSRVENNRVGKRVEGVVVGRQRKHQHARPRVRPRHVAGGVPEGLHVPLVPSGILELLKASYLL